MFIDSNGDAEGNYSVIALMDDVSMNDSFKMSMQPVGFFQYNTSSTVPHLPVSVENLESDGIFMEVD